MHLQVCAAGRWLHRINMIAHCMQRSVRAEGAGPGHSTGFPRPQQYYWRLRYYGRPELLLVKIRCAGESTITVRALITHLSVFAVKKRRVLRENYC